MTKAFSLIELMVVIAIIALLSAVAFPAYQNYMITTRMSESGAALQDKMEKSIEYSAVNGTFAGRFSDLGIYQGSQTSDEVLSQLIPYFQTGIGYELTDHSDCGQSGTVAVQLNPTEIGAPSSITYIRLDCDFWNYNNIINKTCYYSYCGTNGCDTVDDMIPGWINGNTPALAEFWHANGYYDATCQ